MPHRQASHAGPQPWQKNFDTSRVLRVCELHGHSNPSGGTNRSGSLVRVQAGCLELYGGRTRKRTPLKQG